ncbi:MULTISPECIES: hypothetical protein [unclassified Lentimicrobium]|uniref:hypothetical protein n=1 Tax=unclassified Lentimicrobium TaxID=2677434 RepID=UPI001556677C|nr:MULTISPECIES: hypothetical protein [unclassified Lentimicrobium]NPD46669.1 hypothetical protein [Lentimicrobium sp. S6]NPD85494.1 hypothetical protein [Lentimicrobium sp. L6]
MKKYFSFIISVFISVSIYSQQNFESAYIIDNQGDTIAGFIDYRNWNTNPNHFKFKSSEDSEEVIYSTGEIKSFKVHEELYVNAEVEVEISARSTSALKFDSELKIDKQKVFLLVILQGEKSLYYLKDELGYENFYIKMDNDFILLTYKRFLKEIDQKNVIIENTKFRGQLTYYLSECKKLGSSISKANYTRESLERVFENYYKQCTENKPALITKAEKPAFSYGLIAGLSITQVKFDGTNELLTRLPFPKSSNIYAGGFFEIIFSRSKGKVSLYNELAYTSYETNNSYEDRYSKEYVEIGSSNLILVNMFRYKQTVGKVSLFANVGVLNSFVIGTTNYSKVENKFNNTVKEGLAIEDVRSWSFGGALGAGVMWKSFSVEYRYQISQGISYYMNLSSWTNKNIFLLGYRF